MENFNQIIEKLQVTKIPCRVKLDSYNDITIECGRNYPDELIDQIYEAIGNSIDNVSVCAESSGGNIIRNINIAGGPKRYS